MMFQRRFTLVGICITTLTMEGFAQSFVVVGSQRRANPIGEYWQECSVAARVDNANEVVISAQEFGVGVHYAISTLGGAGFTTGTLAGAGDSGVTVDPATNRIWLSCLGLGGVAAYWKEPGALSFSAGYKAANAMDRPLMAISPGVNSRHYLLYSNGHPTQSVWSAYSDTPIDGQLWSYVRVEPYDNYPTNDYEGWGKTPVVLDDGRLVVVNTDADPSLGGRHNSNLPVVVYSDNSGLDWKPDVLPPVLAPSALDSQIVATQVDSNETIGDTPLLIDRRKCAPAIAVNRNVTPNDVYVAFYARATHDTDMNKDSNTDLYIARSDLDGNVLIFPIDQYHLLRLSDVMLTGQPGGESAPDQVMPSLAIDGCGGVNVVFYDNRNSIAPEEWWDLYYVRIVNFETGNPVIQHQARLTPQPFKLEEGSGDFLGDYHHFAVAGTNRKTLYTAYIAAAQDGGGGWSERNCYLHKMQVYCLGGSGFGEGGGSEDVDQFLTAYEAGDLTADVSGEGWVDEEDYGIFWKAYEEAGGSP